MNKSTLGQLISAPIGSPFSPGAAGSLGPIPFGAVPVAIGAQCPTGYVVTPSAYYPGKQTCVPIGSGSPGTVTPLRF